MPVALRLDMISVGERARRGLGDLDELARSIATIGLLHPIVVTPDRRLVAGQRRMEAARLLGWETIPATIAHSLTDATALLLAERDENTCRLPFTPSEQYALARQIEGMYAAEAKERQGTRTDLGREPSGKLPESPEARRSRTQVAKAVGTSRTNLRKIGAVIEAAESPDTPEPVREVAKAAMAEMDRTGKVDPAYRTVADVIDEVAVLPDAVDAKYRAAITRATHRLGKDFLTLDPERCAAVGDENTAKALALTRRRVTDWFDRYDGAARPQLAIVKEIHR